MVRSTAWRILLTFLGHAREKMGVRQEGRCRPGSPGSRRPAGGAPGSKRLRRSWPGSPTAPGEPPGGASWKAAASRTAGMTTPPRRGSPARSSSAGWPRPEPPRGGAHRRTAHRIPGSRAAPRLPRGRRADGRRDRRDRHDRTRSRPSPATETSPFSRRRGRQAVFRRIPPALGPLLAWVPSVDGSNREKISVNRAPRPAPAHRAPAQRGVR